MMVPQSEADLGAAICYLVGLLTGAFLATYLRRSNPR